MPNPSGYPTSTTVVHEVTFDAVTTSRLRAVLNASPNSATPPQYSALAVEEWEVHQAQPAGVAPVAVSTAVGVQPELPETVALDYGDAQLGAPVHWDPIDEADLAAAGTFTVQGFAEGYAAGAVEATVTVLGEDPWRTNLASTGTPQAEFTADGNSFAALNDGAIAYTGGTVGQVWTTWSDDRPATRWAGYAWAEPVRVDEVVPTSGAISRAQTRETAWPCRSRGSCRRSSMANGARCRTPTRTRPSARRRTASRSTRSRPPASGWRSPRSPTA